MFIARIGIIAQKMNQLGVLVKSVSALKKFDQRYLAKQRELRPEADRCEAALLNEIDELKSDLQQSPWFFDPEEASFFTRITPEDIDNFAARLT